MMKKLEGGKTGGRELKSKFQMRRVLNKVRTWEAGHIHELSLRSSLGERAVSDDSPLT